MARYIGPKSKIARKFGEPVFGSDKSFEKRNYPPGQHGNNKRRGKKSEYAIQLMEKQKAKYTYGILEKQFRIIEIYYNQNKELGKKLLLKCINKLKDQKDNDYLAVSSRIFTSFGNNFPKEKLAESIPMNRFGSPQDVAEAVFFLSSEKASYITGTVLNVNGGMLMSWYNISIKIFFKE